MFIEERPVDHTNRTLAILILLVIVSGFVVFFMIFTTQLPPNPTSVNPPTKTATPIPSNTNTTTSGPITTTTIEPKPEPKVITLKINELVAFSNASSGYTFKYFITSACYYAGRVVDDRGFRAVFNVIGVTGSGTEVYTFTVENGGNFVLYGIVYRVTVDTWNSGNIDVTLTQIS